MKRNIELPSAGATFSFRLEDGRFSTCRVLRETTPSEIREIGGKAVLVACSKWIGCEAPTVKMKKLRPILKLTHHSWAGTKNVLWVSEEPPEELELIGYIKPSFFDKRIKCASYGRWQTLLVQPLAQWNWDNRRAEVLRGDELEKVENQKEREKQLTIRKNYLESVTLVELLEHNYFSKWIEYPPKEAIAISKNIMISTVKSLIKLGEDATQQEKLNVLRNCIEKFNDADEGLAFIETIEREDICEEYDAIVHACGLGEHQNLADNWRNW